MDGTELYVGAIVKYQGEECEIKELPNAESAILEGMITYARHEVPQSALIRVGEEWELAHEREAVIAPLAALKKCPLAAAEEAAIKLRISWRQVYKLLKRYKESGNDSQALLRGRSSGGRGKSRLDPQVDAIIDEVLAQHDSASGKINAAALALVINRRCEKLGLAPPSYVTVWYRVNREPI